MWCIAGGVACGTENRIGVYRKEEKHNCEKLEIIIFI